MSEEKSVPTGSERETLLRYLVEEEAEDTPTGLVTLTHHMTRRMIAYLRAVASGADHPSVVFSRPEGETRREYLARKMQELADATRRASKLLPYRPITGEVIACAGIMAMANLLDEVSRALAASPPEAREEPERISSKTWDALEAIRARIARHGYDDLQREMADIIDRLVPPVEPEG